jgi:hypothetical protein
MKMKYSVNQWCSHPSLNNDDLNTGEDFDDINEAIACFNGNFKSYIEYVELIGLEGDQFNDLLPHGCIRKNPDFRPSKDDDGEWKREQAIQAGMSGGCQAFNDIMGW